MYEKWLNWFVNTEEGKRLRNPRGAIQAQKSAVLQMLQMAFDGGMKAAKKLEGQANAS